jgi:hypothetical protein
MTVYISLPEKLAHDFLMRSAPEKPSSSSSPKSAPSVLEMPHHSGLVSTMSTISRDDATAPPILGATRGDDDNSSPLSKNDSRYPRCVVSASCMLDDARTYSELSTLTPEQLVSMSHNKNDEDEHNTKAIDLSLRFLNGIPPLSSTAQNNSTSLMPGLSYQKFDDFSHSTPFLRSRHTNDDMISSYLPMRPRAMPNQYRRRPTMPNKSRSLSNVFLQSGKSSATIIQNSDDPPVSLLSACSLHGKMITVDPDSSSVHKILPNQIEVAPSSSFLSDENSELDEREEQEEEEDNNSDDVYVSFDEQGEEHTLCDFEGTVAGTIQSLSDESSFSTAASDDGDWPYGIVLQESDLQDPTGLLNAVDRVFDCFDPQAKSEQFKLEYSPQTYDEKTLDGDLEWEAAMERDGVDFLFPCCDDFGLDKEFGNIHFLDDCSTVGDVTHSEKLCYPHLGSHSETSLSDSMSALVKTADTSHDNAVVSSKDFGADRTMMTEIDSSLELSMDS